MIPWIQVYSNLPQHRKTSHLAEELKLSSAAVDPNMVAVGILVGLWTWAIQNAYDGDLSGCSPRTIANACQWKKKPEALVEALKKSGWLDGDMRLHDWEEYAVQLMDQEETRKARQRDRVKRYRDKKSSGGYDDALVTGNVTGDAVCNVTATSRSVTGDVTVTLPPSSPLPFPPDPLISPPYIPPNQTRPNQTRPIFSGGGGDAGARAQDSVADFCIDRNSDPDEYFGMTPEIRAEVAAITDAIFARFTTRPATENDRSQVFLALYDSRRDEATGQWVMTLPEENKRLLMYAFEAASNAGKSGDWRYITGVLARLRQRGIRTLAQAEDYDEDRSTERM